MLYKPTVALLQNQFRLSGRTKVICETISILNENDIVPDVLTLTPASIGKKVGSYFGLNDLRYNYIRVAPIPFYRGGLWQIFLLNWLTRSRQGQYTLVFNSNNSLEGLNPNALYLHYIYYPLPNYSTEVKTAEQIPGHRVYSAISSWILSQSKKLAADNDVYTISEFSREAILISYPELQGKVQIIYPPSFDGTLNKNSSRLSHCITVGVFTPAKNQIQQLEIASQLPTIEFWLAGNVKWRNYYEQCESYIRLTNIPNAHLKPNMPFDTLQHALCNSKFFLHTMQGEHFGISTVEAIAAGCIPVVHNSGGQREVVPFEDLRFNTTEEAVSILNRLSTMSEQDLSTIRHTLQQHIKRFDRNVFRASMRDALWQKLGHN